MKEKIDGDDMAERNSDQSKEERLNNRGGDKKNGSSGAESGQKVGDNKLGESKEKHRQSKQRQKRSGGDIERSGENFDKPDRRQTKKTNSNQSKQNNNKTKFDKNRFGCAEGGLPMRSQGNNQSNYRSKAKENHAPKNGERRVKPGVGRAKEHTGGENIGGDQRKGSDGVKKRIAGETFDIDREFFDLVGRLRDKWLNFDK